MQKKSVHSINSLLRYSQFLSPVTRLVTPISDHAQPNIFWSIFNWREFVLTYKKTGRLIDLFWRYGWLKNPVIWLAENILGHVTGTKIFPNIRFVQEHINFHYKTNSIKINDKFVNKFKKILTLAYFWFIFLILGAKHFFSKTRLGHAHLNMDFQEHAKI